MEISFSDCKTELLDKATAKGQEAYREWRARPHGQEVVRFVENFTHKELFKFSYKDLRKVMEASEHPLGNVRKEEAITFIEDFTCPFALQHILHEYIEHKASVPTWQEFDAYLNNDAKDKWMLPLRSYLSTSPAVKVMAEKKGRERAWEEIKRGIRWRLGKFYLSAMRELDLLARLNEAGVPVRYHLLADALLKVDFWIGKTLVCVFFENSKYRGRKHPAELFFTGFNIIHARIERQGFGRFWLATDKAVNELSTKLLSSDK